MISWRTGRWIALLTALVTGIILTLGNIPLLGIGLDYEVFGITAKMLLGIGNFIVVWILWKLL